MMTDAEYTEIVDTAARGIGLDAGEIYRGKWLTALQLMERERGLDNDTDPDTLREAVIGLGPERHVANPWTGHRVSIPCGAIVPSHYGWPDAAVNAIDVACDTDGDWVAGMIDCIGPDVAGSIILGG